MAKRAAIAQSGIALWPCCKGLLLEASPVQFITGLFGGSGNTVLTMVFALGIVVVLIVLAVWLLKLVSNVSGNAVRGRNKRLAVIDTLALDQKRQLLIIRRDEVEHLILTGGPQDIVVETGFAMPEIPQNQTAPRRSLPALGARKTAADQSQQRKPEAGVETEEANAKSAASENTGRSTPRSLRHTGLLRPVSVQDPTLSVQNLDSSAESAFDSAKEVENETASEGAALEHQNADHTSRN